MDRAERKSEGSISSGVRSIVEERERKKKEKAETAVMGPSHFLFHPLGRTCLRPEECPVFTFPPSHFSSPHTLGANTDFSPPLPPLFPNFNGAVQTILSEL